MLRLCEQEKDEDPPSAPFRINTQKGTRGSERERWARFLINSSIHDTRSEATGERASLLPFLLNVPKRVKGFPADG